MPRKSEAKSKRQLKQTAARKTKLEAEPKAKKRFARGFFRVVGRILWPRFIRNAWKELRMVTWPSWRQSRQLTVAVLIFAIIFAATVGLTDWGLNKLFKELFLR